MSHVDAVMRVLCCLLLLHAACSGLCVMCCVMYVASHVLIRMRCLLCVGCGVLFKVCWLLYGVCCSLGVVCRVLSVV